MKWVAEIELIKMVKLRVLPDGLVDVGVLYEGRDGSVATGETLTRNEVRRIAKVLLAATELEDGA